VVFDASDASAAFCGLPADHPRSSASFRRCVLAVRAARELLPTWPPATGTAWEGTSDDAPGEQCKCRAFHLLTSSSTASITSATRDTTSLRWPGVIR
jgi:hypothetical protein